MTGCSRGRWSRASATREKDFNRRIEIKEREAHRVQLLLEKIDQREKTLVFCATQDHAALVRDLINQQASSGNPLYCCRVTANDGALGEQYLRDFQDNEKTIPTVQPPRKNCPRGSMPGMCATSCCCDL